MKKIKIIFKFIIVVFLAIILILNIGMIFSRTILHQNNPKFLGYFTAVVTSGSMEPEISAGDFLIYKTDGNYDLNDVVIYNNGAGYITHRIVGVNDTGFWTKGDANNTNDEPIKKNMVEGRAIAKLSGIGSILLFFRSPLGILILILIGFALIELPRCHDNVIVLRQNKS